VVFQFTIAIILIVSITIIYKQIDFVQTRHLGYEKDNVIYFSQEGKTAEKTDIFLTEIGKILGILSASSIGHNLLFQNDNTSGVDWEGKNPDDNIYFEHVRVNYNLIETLGMEIVEGRTFSEEFGTESTKIIFNEAAIKVMNIEDPIGKSITLNTGMDYDMEIIGVVKDFHFQSLHEEVKPLFMRLSPYTSNIMARIQAGKEKETLKILGTFYVDFNPGYAFEYRFMDDTYQQHYAAEQRVSTLARYFAGMAIVISCLGLFGLASFTAQRRQKEIGIRKVLGASVLSIVRILSGDFTKMVIAAIAIALPISFFLARSWLENFAFHMDLKWWYFVISALSALLIAWLTVGLQTVRAARVNPVNCLRDE
jgi:ABC-type antimicrobial peptide transport system permease subunit